MYRSHKFWSWIVLGLLLAASALPGLAQEPAPESPAVPETSLGTAFLYQGRLDTPSGPADGACDLIFRLYGSLEGTDQIGSDLAKPNTSVDDGYLSVSLDFGSGAFDGEERWLGIQVRCPAGTGGYATLSPRQRLAATPYALYASSANLLARNPNNTEASVALSWYNDGSLDWPRIRYGGNGSGATTGFLIQGPGDSTKLAIRESGAVGIGTSSPVARLQVVAGASERAMYLSGGPTISLSSLTDKWNLVPTSGEARLPMIATDWDSGGGIGFMAGNNVASPVVWMYASSGRNAFTVARKSYGGTGVDVTGIDSKLTPLFQVRENGRVGIGTVNPLAKLDVAGTTRTDTLQIDAGSDLAEPFEVTGPEAIKPGMVVAIDPDHAGQLRIADAAYDRTVAGCVSGANGIQPGLVMRQEGSAADGSWPVALSGRVFCLADASSGAIRPGDLLTTSGTPGHAMAVQDYARAQGAILGKAMTALEEGQGFVLVLVSLQ